MEEGGGACRNYESNATLLHTHSNDSSAKKASFCHKPSDTNSLQKSSLAASPKLSRTLHEPSKASGPRIFLPIVTSYSIEGRCFSQSVIDH